MKLLHLNNNNIEIETSLLYVKEFKDIWNADKSKNKEQAKNEFAIIYMLCDHQSYYMNYNEMERLSVVSEDMYNKKEFPERIIKACAKYKEMLKTPIIEYLEAQLYALNKSKEFFYNIDWNERDEKGALVYDISKIQTAMSKSTLVVDNIRKLIDQINKEKENSTVRGGVELGQFANGYD